MAKKVKGYVKYMMYMCFIEASEVCYTCNNKKDHIVKSLALPNDHVSFYCMFSLASLDMKQSNK